MKRIVAFLLALAFGFAMFAEDMPKMYVASFELAQNDNTANLAGSIVYDQNGDKCALIRVQTTHTGFSWDFGQMQPVKVDQKTGEVWLYVPYGVKRVTIRHPKYESISYDFPIPIQKARTYNMRITATGFTIIVDQEVTQQWVIFKLNPQDAVVLLDDQPLETKYGQAKKFVSFGSHNFSIFSKNYVTMTGTVEVNDPDNAKIVEINLKANFARVTVNTLEGSEIYANGERLGLAPWTGNLAFDTYSFEIKKSSYRSAYSNLEFTRESSTNIELPSPTPIYGGLNIDCEPPASITIDGVSNGYTPKFIPKILIGSHEIVLSASGFDSSKRTVYVEEGKIETLSAELEKKAVPVQATSQTGSHEYVDLGLSVKWATCNVGASKPEEYGDYYAWGSTIVKEYGQSYSLSGISTRGNILSPENDIAHIRMGGAWRMPTYEEWNELKEKCFWSWTKLNGVSGYRISGKREGYTNRSIFIPAAGANYVGDSPSQVGEYGLYWTSKRSSGKEAYYMLFSNGVSGINPRDVNLGFSVRGVLD